MCEHYHNQKYRSCEDHSLVTLTRLSTGTLKDEVHFSDCRHSEVSPADTGVGPQFFTAKMTRKNPLHENSNRFNRMLSKVCKCCLRSKVHNNNNYNFTRRDVKLRQRFATRFRFLLCFIYIGDHTPSVFMFYYYLCFILKNFFFIVKEQIYTRTLKTKHNMLLERKTYLLNNFFFLFTVISVRPGH